MGHIFEVYQVIRRRFETFSKKCVQTLTKNSKTTHVKKAKQIASEVGALKDIKVPRYSAQWQLPYRPWTISTKKWSSLRFVRKTGKVVIYSCKLLVPSVARKCGDLHNMKNKLQFGRTTSLFVYVIIAKWNKTMEVSLDPTGTTRTDPTTLFELVVPFQ